MAGNGQDEILNFRTFLNNALYNFLPDFITSEADKEIILSCGQLQGTN